MLATDACAFRNQLVIPGQIQLYDYWRERAGSRIMPSRSDVDPLDIPTLLPSISLIDVTGDVLDYRIRLAGSDVRDTYGFETTGLTLGEIDWGLREAYWARRYECVTRNRKPARGLIREPVRGRDHIMHHWLRLPLSSDGETVDMILSHDVSTPFDMKIANVKFTQCLCPEPGPSCYSGAFIPVSRANRERERIRRDRPAAARCAC